MGYFKRLITSWFVTLEAFKRLITSWFVSLEAFKRLITSWFVSLEAFKMYYVMRASAPSLHRESTDSLINR